MGVREWGLSHMCRLSAASHVYIRSYLLDSNTPTPPLPVCFYFQESVNKISTQNVEFVTHYYYLFIYLYLYKSFNLGWNSKVNKLPR